jgi:hypothetical protein
MVNNMNFWQKIEDVPSDLLEDINDDMYETDPENWMGNVTPEEFWEGLNVQ